MKNKIAFLYLVLLIFLYSCYAKKLDISIEYNSKNTRLIPTCYWVNNNTGKDIPNVEYILNDNYFYSYDLPANGSSLDLFDFAKRDGTRYDFYSVKPIELKVKSKNGTYSVKFEDIPYKKELSLYSPSISEELIDKREPLLYSQIIEAITVNTSDAIATSVTVQVAFGYSSNDKSTPQEISTRKVEITEFLQSYFKSKTVQELKQEKKIKIEIRNEINDNILTKTKIKDVSFTKYEIGEP